MTRDKKISVKLNDMQGWTSTKLRNMAGMKTNEDYPTMEACQKRKQGDHSTSVAYINQYHNLAQSIAQKSMSNSNILFKMYTQGQKEVIPTYYEMPRLVIH